MQILATDLDRTLLPNGSWPADPGAIELFNDLTQRHTVLLVYVTGRNLDLTEQAIAEFGIRYPDVLIGDVGTSIRRYSAEGWVPVDGSTLLTGHEGVYAIGDVIAGPMGRNARPANG